MRQAELFHEKNLLFSGDNLRVLRHRISDASVDFIYLDPPFKSNQDYNLLFKERSGKRAASQMKAFEDTWQWDEAAVEAFHDVVENGPSRVSQAMQALRDLVGHSDMLAYLSMMAPRLIEMHRVLRDTGSLFLHCDPTASHYLKALMDAVFSPTNFRNEIIWQRTASKSLMTGRFPNNHDVILGYQKSEGGTWNKEEVFIPYEVGNLDEKTEEKYRQRDPDGRLYQLTSLINPNPNRPNLTYEFLGITRVWRWTRERMQKAYEAGLLVQTKPGGVPRLKRYLDEQRGRPIGDVWGDIPPLNSQAKEREGYPTQKPLALVERLIRIASNPGDVILDPFCGCGTTVDAALSLGRRWIGIDVTQLAVDIIEDRLVRVHGVEVQETYELARDPASSDDAARLAKDDPYQFQWWILDRLGARESIRKKGADRGIDGRVFFHETPRGRTEQVVVQVKGGKTGPAHVRDLRGVLEREKAAIGVLVVLTKPTRQMRTEAAEAGFYEAWGHQYPRIQILTVSQIIDENIAIDYPHPDWLHLRGVLPTEDEVPVGRPSEAKQSGDLPKSQVAAEKQGRRASSAPRER